MAIGPPAKRRKISPVETEEQQPDDRTQSRRRKNAFVLNTERWNLDGAYERRLRRHPRAGAEIARLPIKTPQGRVEHVITPSLLTENDASTGSSESLDNELEASESSSPQDTFSPQQEILSAKEELARAAAAISESPEENVGRLKRLAQIGKSRNVVVKKLALATQMTVFKDIIPGYRIKEWSESETGVRLTKEVKALRNFEQTLVSSYQIYVQDLSRQAKDRTGRASGKTNGLGSVAISCACGLLASVPHFNFRNDVAKILVENLSHSKLNADSTKCLETIESLFRDDDDGQPSLDLVAMLARMMKARNFNVHEATLNTFLQLRLLSEFSLKASSSSVDKDNEVIGKLTKKNREFRTKKERKAVKELKQVSKEMREADAVVGREERERLQAESLKLVFTTYFKILKARSAPLTGAVLEGLAKYAHLINQDFFGDILEVLRDLCEQAVRNEAQDLNEADADEDGGPKVVWTDPQRAVLLCTVTALELLSGQDAFKTASSLNLDLSFFMSTLYQILPELSLSPDVELSSKSLHVPDPRTVTGAAAKVNARATSTLLVKALSAALLPRATPPLRVAAFSHRLETTALQAPERTATALLGIMSQVSKVHGRKMAGLWDTEERRGDGTFDQWGSELEGANPYAGTIWCGELLKLHYAPSVREGLNTLEKGIYARKGKT